MKMFHRTITSNPIKLVTKYSWVRFVKVSPCPMENTSDNKTVKIRWKLSKQFSARPNKLNFNQTWHKHWIEEKIMSRQLKYSDNY